MRTRAQDFRRQQKKPYEGLDALSWALWGVAARRRSKLKSYLERGNRICEESARWGDLSDNALRQRLQDYRPLFRRRSKSAPVEEAMGAVREAAYRTVGLVAYPEQIAGSLGLLEGFLVEMATGEGKTLTAGLAAAIAGWSGRPCHVITANDYLVKRDSEGLKAFYGFCGATVGSISGQSDQEARRQAHHRDITYCTSKELLGDYLRDALQAEAHAGKVRQLISTLKNVHPSRRRRPVLRGLYRAIVDEADSLLIDEAVTPLIISRAAPNPSLKKACLAAKEVADQLERDIHFTVLEKERTIRLTEEGQIKLDDACRQWDGFWKGYSRRAELITQALTAAEFYQKGVQYIVESEKIVIVDEFTGRLMPNRSWRQGIHQAIEAKEGLPLSDPTETAARRSFQSFFRSFTELSGMTGTATEANSELWQIYGLPMLRIPTHKPCIREELPSRYFRSESEKWKAFVRDIQEAHETGRPILVGTRSVAISERVAKMLFDVGLHCRILNATRLEEEAMIVAQAGEPGRITVATNMAGRGTDIKLSKASVEAGGLYVVATELHESKRIDRQLFGRCARQGDPGTSRSYGCVEDELARRFAPPISRYLLKLSGSLLPAPFIGWTLKRGQRRAEKLASQRRKAVLANDLWLERSLAFAADKRA